MSVSSRARRGIRSRFLDLPLFLKLLVPFLVLMLLLGTVGGFLIVRDLSSRAATTLDQDLSRRSLEVRSILRDRELYLLESVNLAANLQGMADAVRAGDRDLVADLLRSVLALKTDLDLVVVADGRGTGLVEFARAVDDPRHLQTAGAPWSSTDLVGTALADATGAKRAGFLQHGGRGLLAVAGAVCSSIRTCSATGVAVVGIDSDRLAAEAVGKLRSAAPTRETGVAIYDLEGRPIAADGLAAAPAAGIGSSADQLVRRTHRTASGEAATLFAPLELQGERQGTIATSVATGPAFSSVRGAGIRLALVLLTGLAGIVAIGVLLSRLILAQVRPLVATNRSLGSGDLSARAPVLGHDELGELASGVNQMAEQLEASVETLELQVQQRTEEVRRLLQERTDLFTAISHEFRTPLAVILRQADMLLDPKTPKTGRWTAESGRTLKESGRQLLSLINDILDLAKAEVGGLEVTLEKVKLDEVVKDARRTIEALAKGNRLGVSVRLPSRLPAVRADPTRLREIILNLVDNAVKYTPPGGRVELSATARNGKVRVSVADTGVGIPPEARERIFEPFYRVEGVKAQRGQASTGLGLALTKRLVEAHGGDITFTSEPDAGTTFTFTLVPA